MIALLLGVAACLAAAGVVLYDRRRTRQTLERINLMLDAAIRGDFTAEDFDESLMSAMESRLAQYLTASSLSAGNLAREKDRLNELIGDISHQTKTPVANLVLYAQLLQEQELPPQTVSLAANLEAQAEKLRFLIQSLVKVSRLESGVLAVMPSPGPVRPSLESALAQIAPAAEAKGIALSLRDPGCAAVLDPKWTAEAVYNLLDNAVKYTPAGGAVSVCAVEYELFCRIDVQDNGIGIAEAEQAKVFGRFYRSPAVRDDQGVGLGLYLTREIATAQGGYLKLSSHPGQGSTFSLFLPRGKAKSGFLQNC